MQAGTEKQIEDIDIELLAAGIPLRYRPLDCFKRLYGSVPDGSRRNELFDPLIDWYLKKYGDAVRWDGVVARFPILIRGVVYLGQARFVGEGEVLANFQEGIEQLPDSVARSLNPEERRSILEKLTFGPAASLAFTISSLTTAGLERRNAVWSAVLFTILKMLQQR